MPPPQSPLPLPAHGSPVTILFLSLCVRSDTGSQTKTEILFSILRPYPNNHIHSLQSTKHCLVLSRLFSHLLFFFIFSFYLEPASQTGKSSSNILPGTSFKPGNYLTILSTLSFHYIHIFYYRLALYVHQKLCILFYFVCLSYSSIILIKLAIKIKKRWSFIVIIACIILIY